MPTGVGLGLRTAMLDEVVAGAADARVAFFEIAPETFVRRGGSVPAALERIADRFPLLSHGLSLSLGGGDDFDPAYLSAIAELLVRFDLPWHSDHLAVTSVDGTCLHDLLPLPLRRATAARVAERVARVRDRLGRPMLVENVSFYQGLGVPELDEAGFVAEVCERADCGLLLDLNNVVVNARNFGFDPRAWIAAAPLSRVAQIHVAGHECWEPGLYVDTHGAAVDADVRTLLGEVVERLGPVPVVLERDHRMPALSLLLAEIAELQAIYDAAIARRTAERPP